MLDRCGCAPCRAANAVAERRRSTAISYGTWTGLVTAAPAREHVLVLPGQGLSVPPIAALAGVGHGTVSVLVYGVPTRRQPPPAQIRAETEQRLLRSQLDSGRAPRRRDRHSPPPAGAGDDGLVGVDAARHGAVLERTLRRALSSHTVRADTARAVAAVYDELHRTQPPRRTAHERTVADRARRHPLQAGWLPPVAWEDLDSDPDEPDVAPDHGEGLDEIAVERAMSGQLVPLTGDERREAVARLTRRGLSARRIAELLHTTSRTVTRLRSSCRAAAA